MSHSLPPTAGRHTGRCLVRSLLPTLLLALVLTALLAFYWLVIATQITLPAGADYTKFYYAADQARHGQPSYAAMNPARFGAAAAEFFQSPLVADPPLHMPQVTAAYIPLALLPFAQSFWLWSILAMAAGLGACTILWRTLYGPQARFGTLLWIWVALLAFFPTFTALRLGQGSLAVFLLVTLTWAAARRGHSRRAGIALGLAFSLRTFAGLLLFYFLLKRQWRLLLWSGATFAASLVASLPFVGVQAYSDWLGIATGLAIQGRNWNASFAGFFARLLAPGPALTLTLICSALGLALLGWLSWPRGESPRGTQRAPQHWEARDDLTFSLALGLMLLLSPLGWMYYFPVLFVGGLVIWRQTGVSGQRGQRGVLLPAWLLSNIPTAQYPVAELVDPLGWWTWNSVYFYALLIFCGLLAYMAARDITSLDQNPPPR